MDRDKVINYLESEIKRAEQSVNDTWLECVEVKLFRDVLALLKEQEAVEPIVDSFLNRRCPKCNAVLKGKFCFECGQAVKWRG